MMPLLKLLMFGFGHHGWCILHGCEVSPSPPMIPFVRPSRLHPLHYRANRVADTSLNGQFGASIKMTK
jgi:hypothetical protein